MAERLVQKVPAPALPIPKAGPVKQYLDDLNNILRLFFNLLSNAVNSVFGEQGGRFIEAPNAKFFSTTDQTASVVDTAYALQFENTYLGEAISITGTPKTRITPLYSGVYNFELSVELTSSNANSKELSFWVRRSGVDIANTGRMHVVAGSGGVDDFEYSFTMDLTAGQYIELMWATDDTGITIDYQAAASPRPAVPSTLLTVVFVSALPETLPTP
ncbi:hypothetical protein OAU05_00590 [bacterium]|nr:hypothetical protein [bacterium]